MDPTTSRLSRDRLIAVAAFAYAFSFLYAICFNLWNDIQQTGRDLGAWAIDAHLLATAYSFGQCIGFVILGVAFGGNYASRNRRIRLGAYWIVASFLLASAASLMSYGYAYGPEESDWHSDALIIATTLAYLAAAITAAVFALAFRSEVSRGRRLGVAALLVGAYAGLLILAGVFGGLLYGFTTRSALGIAAYSSLLVGASAASLAFFGYERKLNLPCEPRKAGLLLISAGAVTLFTAIMFARYLTHMPAYWDSWLYLLASAGVMVAGICLLVAFVFAYRSVPRPAKPEPRQREEPVLPECPDCGTRYDPAEYREDADAWLCVSCGAKLRLV